MDFIRWENAFSSRVDQNKIHQFAHTRDELSSQNEKLSLCGALLFDLIEGGQNVKCRYGGNGMKMSKIH